MYTNHREAYRATFTQAWHKFLRNEPLLPIEQEIVEVIRKHPVYHPIINGGENNLEFALEENPYIHLSLHLSLNEQLKLNRPAGIQQIYQSLMAVYPDTHAVEDQMIHCLSKVMLVSQQKGEVPNEESYLTELKKWVTSPNSNGHCEERFCRSKPQDI